jgi:hypothetical protein
MNTLQEGRLPKVIFGKKPGHKWRKVEDNVMRYIY